MRQPRIYDSKRWLRLRTMVLNEEPLCRACAAKSIDTAATEVDHIKDIADGGEPYDRANTQPLCSPCHSAKTRATQLAKNANVGKDVKCRRLGA